MSSGGKRQYTYDANGNLTQEVQVDAAGKIIPSKGRTEIYTSFNMPQALGAPGISLAFAYGPEHQRVKQIAPSATTIYLHPDNTGGLAYEKDLKADGTTEHKHFITAGGQVVVLVKQSGTTTKTLYFHRDHLGSTSAITDWQGTVIERLAYEPFGKRRFTTGTTDPNNTIVGTHTDRGYTNHEHLDELGLIHMNGRIYDPLMARFMSADPFIQAPDNLQSYNRYAYVLNNPLAYTDPSGYFSFKKFVRAAVAIGVAYYLGPVGGGKLIAGKAIGAVIGNAAIAGFAAGAIQTGTLKGAMQGAVSGALFAGAGQLANGFAFSAAQDSFGRALFHAGAGCLSASMSGGSCGTGALTAGFTKFAGSNLPEFNNVVADTVKWAVIGGTASVMAGGKFENGATTGAFQYLFNQLAGRFLTAPLAAPSNTSQQSVSGDREYDKVEGLSRSSSSSRTEESDRNIYRHYTDKEGFESIHRDRMIKGNRLNMVFATPLDVSSSEAANVLFAGMQSHAGRGDYVITFSPKPGVLFVPFKPGEFVHFGSLRFDRHIDLISSGKNR